MGLFKKVTKAVKKAYDSSLGDVINPSNYLTREITGISNTNQAAIGGTVGAATFLQGLLNVGGLSGSGDSNTSLLSSLLGGDGILSSVVKGAVGIGGDYLSNEWQQNAQEKLNNQTFQQNRQLADEAYQRDVAMWNMQNAYNSPEQQVLRLEKAGLNKNLVYGGGNVSGNTAGSPPSYPQIQVPTRTANRLDLARNLLGIFNEYQSIKNQALQNQRENAKIALQEQALQLSEKRLDKQEADSERRFQIMLANLGLAQDRMNQPSAVVRNAKSLEQYASDKSEAFFSWLLPKLSSWWNRPLKNSGDIPELF